MISVKDEVLQLTDWSIRREHFGTLGLGKEMVGLVRQFTFHNNKIMNAGQTRIVGRHIERILWNQ